MKSSKESLQQRGFASEEEIETLRQAPQDELMKLLQTAGPVARTAAACCLARSIDNPDVAEALLSQLSRERCLYTRIAVCEALQAGSVSTAEKMVCYLGKIGTNQHRSLPLKPSGKKSFPLPRDLIARSLGKMEPSILPVLLEVLNSADSPRISEALDAIGFLVFYHPELATPVHFEAISLVLHTYWDILLQSAAPEADSALQKHIEPSPEYIESAQVIVWKCLLCLSAFPLKQSVDLLEEFAPREDLLGLEARRSLALISQRQKR